MHKCTETRTKQHHTIWYITNHKKQPGAWAVSRCQPSVRLCEAVLELAPVHPVLASWKARTSTIVYPFVQYRHRVRQSQMETTLIKAASTQTGTPWTQRAKSEGPLILEGPLTLALVPRTSPHLRTRMSVQRLRQG